MAQPAPYGYLPKLAQQAVEALGIQTLPALLVNYMQEQLAANGFTSSRDSCYAQVHRALRESMKVHASEPSATAEPEQPEQATAAAADEEDAGPWSVFEEHYSWSSQSGSFHRPVSLVDEMFYSYSRHGLNKTQQQMIHDFGLSLWEWNTLKSRLLLQKESNVFSPWTVQMTPADELEDKIEEKISRRYEKQGPLIERAANNAAVKQLNKVLAEQLRRRADLEELALQLSDLLPTVKYRYVARAPQREDGPEHLVFTVADVHVGAEINKLLNAPRYDHAVLYGYADQLIARVNARGAANVYLAGLGDFIESFTGVNHANSWMGMNKLGVGARGVYNALEFMSYLIERIYNIREIWGVSGNHDRTAADKKDDNRGQAAELLFMLLQERYRNAGFTIHYAYDVLIRVVDKICYICTHTHLGLAKTDRRLEQLIARHRVPGYFCLLLGADLHTRITKLDTDDSRVMHSPSLFTGNDYSSENGWSTLAGFLTIENNGDNYPRIIDEPLSAGRFAHARQAA